jgi:hypothetical protein
LGLGWGKTSLIFVANRKIKADKQKIVFLTILSILYTIKVSFIYTIPIASCLKLICHIHIRMGRLLRIRRGPDYTDYQK